MSNYTNLKNAIQSVIKANGNNEITGPILQAELLSMITTLGAGYQYMGVAQPSTNPGTPDARVMYLAYLPGTYVNFGGLTVTGFCVLKYDTVWSKEDIPISGGGGSDFLTEPDDLTLEAVGNTNILKFANRSYNSQNPNGMGYKILRNDLTFAEQVTDASTIYAIRYNYDLNGATVNVPNGCVLKFDGGKISNGILSGNFKIEAAPVKIFSGVTFTGNCRYNQFLVEWFTDLGTDDLVTSNPVSASAELNAMFASGIKRVWLNNNKYYYLGATVTIPGGITIDGAPQVLDQASKSETGIAPCFYVFGDTIAFIIDCGDSDTERRSLWMKAIHVWRINSAFDGSNFKEDIPVVKLDIHQKLWGVDLELFVSAEQKTVSMVVADGTTKSVEQLGYTGLEVYLHGENNYFTYADFTGYYKNLRRAIYIHKELSSNWITDVYVSFDSSCTFGGDVYSARVTGKHQTRTMLPDYESQAYFRAVGRIDLDGTVWDGGSFDSTRQLGSTFYAARSDSGRVTFPQSNYQGRPYPNNLGVLPYDYYIFADRHPSGIANLNLQGNLLENLFHKTFTSLAGDKFDDPSQFRNMNVVRALQYVDTSDNVIDITKENVTFYDKLFQTTYLPAVSNTLQAYIGFPASRAAVPVKEMRVEFYMPFRLPNAIVGVISKDPVKMTITLTDSNGNELYKAEPDDSFMTYYANYAAFWIPIGVAYSNILKISCVSKRNTGVFEERFLPKLFLVDAATSNGITPSGGMVGGNLRMADAEFFNATKRLAGVRTQVNRIVAEEHLLSAINVASTTQILHAQVYSLDDRYLHVKLSNKVGEYYVDIEQTSGTYKTNLNTGTLKVYVKYAPYKADFVITYKATGYMSILEITGSGPTKILDVGEDLTTYTEATRIIDESGTSANRPAASSVPVGFQYFDSDLGKPIWSTGSAWIYSDGTVVQ